MYDAQFSLSTAPPPTLVRAMDEPRQQWLPPVTPQPAPPAPPPSGADTSKRPPWQADDRSTLRKLKILTTSGSMLVSVAAYSLIWGWKFAVGIVLLLLVHEMGHVIQLRREGIEASAPVFIPFLGAAVWAKSLGDDAAAEARVGLAGPVLGTLGAAALVPVALATDGDFWRALAFTGFFLNLFNLLPVVPLDGGRAFAALAPWMWFVGLFAVVLLAFVAPNPIILLIALLAAFETWRRVQERRSGDPA